MKSSKMRQKLLNCENFNFPKSKKNETFYLERLQLILSDPFKIAKCCDVKRKGEANQELQN